MSNIYDEAVPSTSTYNENDSKESGEVPHEEVIDEKNDKSSGAKEERVNEKPASLKHVKETTRDDVDDGEDEDVDDLVVDNEINDEDYDEDDLELGCLQLLMFKSALESNQLPDDLPGMIERMIKEKEESEKSRYGVPNKKDEGR